MYIITYNNKPATLEKLCRVEKHKPFMGKEDTYLTATTVTKIKNLYIHHFGFTWKERPRGVEYYYVYIPQEEQGGTL